MYSNPLLRKGTRVLCASFADRAGDLSSEHKLTEKRLCCTFRQAIEGAETVPESRTWDAMMASNLYDDIEIQVWDHVSRM